MCILACHSPRRNGDPSVKKILNRPADFVDEMLEGLLAAHPDALRSVSPDNRALVRVDAPARRLLG